MLMNMECIMNSTSRVSRKPTNLSLDKELLDEARSLKINLSRVAEDGLRLAVSEAKAEQWKRENQSAIESSNRFIEEHGLPLARYRNF